MLSTIYTVLLKSSLAVNGDANFVTKAKPIDDINGKSHKMELKAAKIIQLITSS